MLESGGRCARGNILRAGNMGGSDEVEAGVKKYRFGRGDKVSVCSRPTLESTTAASRAR